MASLPVCNAGFWPGWISTSASTAAACRRTITPWCWVGGVDKGNLSTSLKGLERKGLIRIHRTPGGKAESIDVIPARSHSGSCE
jgi:hypothetical protein